MNRSVLKKILIVAAIGAVVTALYQLGVFDKLNLEYIKASQAELARYYQDNPVLMISAYFFLYIAVTAFSLPGAVPLTLVGGALFGFLTATVVISFASSIGATLAAFVARFLLRDWVQSKFGDRIKVINDGVEREGAFYLFTMRLVPVFPFFMINLVMGLTKMKLFTFYWVSQIGMLAGTMVYVNAGKELAKIDSLSGILSPSLLASFAALGIFPIAAKKIIEKLKKGRAGQSSQLGGT